MKIWKIWILIKKTTKVNNGPQLPVVWHKAFLSFATRYKNDLTDDQKISY